MKTKLLIPMGWIIILSATVYFIYADVLPYFFPHSSALDNYRPTYTSFLITHIIAGMIAILTGPLQFMHVIRKNYARTYRVTGTIYLCSVFIGALASFYISIPKLIIKDNQAIYGAGLTGFGFAWLLTSGMAYWSIRNKNSGQYKEWMTRSYIVTFAFVAFRVAYDFLTTNFHTDANITAGILAWSCWTIPLLFTEAFLQVNKIRILANTSKRKDASEPRVTITTISQDKKVT